MGKRILVALDNSDYKEKVMLQAIELAKLYKTPIFGISVIDDSYFCDPSVPYSCETNDFWTLTVQSALDICKKMAEENNVDFYQKILNGNPAEQILKYAGQEGMEIIVLGHLGKTAAAGYLMGSVAQKVSAYSKCSVFIVK
jgi:nucleotide-binding universal stress UspA family protein